MEERSSRYRGILTLILLALVAAGAAAWIIRRPEPRPLEIVSPPQPSEPTKGVVKVYVSGEVLNPGVYTLREGDRVEDALRAAGGATETADTTKVNLALRIKDQQQINVPKAVPTQGPGAASIPAANQPASATSPGQGKVNLNTASVAELDALPGVGPVTVQKIIDYREHVGPFQSIEELRDAKIMDRARFENIKDLVTAP